ncbi:unnamed protein product [Phytophthora fragariaefolia]|uniref:Unnamed protein product n=1 Tax=Phytophthora fragariaefolia TaxID=1490495 RepID=A0A9W7DFA8_9STRA|nr:unnamed protein product [Phytophthora fragariaefolia]
MVFRWECSYSSLVIDNFGRFGREQDSFSRPVTGTDTTSGNGAISSSTTESRGGSIAALEIDGTASIVTGVTADTSTTNVDTSTDSIATDIKDTSTMSHVNASTSSATGSDLSIAISSGDNSPRGFTNSSAHLLTLIEISTFSRGHTANMSSSTNNLAPSNGTQAHKVHEVRPTPSQLQPQPLIHQYAMSVLPGQWQPASSMTPAKVGASLQNV